MKLKIGLLLLKHSLLFLSGMLLLSSAVQASSFTLVYSGNLNGELEPCGCSAMANFGGIKRRATALSALRQQLAEKDQALFVVSNGGLITEHDSSDRIRSDYIFSGMASLAYDAIAVQSHDMGFGIDLMLPDQLPWVSPHPAFPDRRLLKTQGTKLAVFSWPEFQWVANSQLKKVDEDLSEALRAAKKSGYITLLFSPLEKDDALKKLPAGAIDILVVRGRDEQIKEPELINGMLVISPGTRGMLMGQLELQTDANGAITSHSHQIIELSDQLADAESLTGWYEQYNDAISQHYKALVKKRKEKDEGQSPYVGAQSCGICHVEQHKIWQESQHANALASLTEVKKDFDPHCLGCHTVGFEQAGGYLDQYITAELANVQCENCHGTGREHSQNPTIKLPNQQLLEQPVCLKCHNREHSPEFKLEEYWPKIEHGLAKPDENQGISG